MHRAAWVFERKWGNATHAPQERRPKESLTKVALFFKKKNPPLDASQREQGQKDNQSGGILARFWVEVKVKFAGNQIALLVHS